MNFAFFLHGQEGLELNHLVNSLFTSKCLGESLAFKCWCRTLGFFTIFLLASCSCLLAAKSLDTLKTSARLLGVDICFLQALASTIVRFSLAWGNTWHWRKDISSWELLRTRDLRWLFSCSMVNSYSAPSVLGSIKGQELPIVLPGRKINITESIGIRSLLRAHSDFCKADTFRLDKTPYIGDTCLVRKFSHEANVNISFFNLALWAAIFAETKSLRVHRGYQGQSRAPLFLYCWVIFRRYGEFDHRQRW